MFFTSLFVWQSNPRDKEEGVVGPFIAWDFQEQALDALLWCVDNDEDILLEKSRQMGASWMLVILFVWLWLFRDNAVLLFISRDEKAVESEKPASLFWKIDFILDRLPSWLMPKNWRRRRMFFGNDDNGSTIFGEASTGKAAVGATLTAMGIDEFSQIEEDYEVLHRTSDATGCRIFNGTHLGLDTAFYELSRRVDFRKLVLHWSQHPRRSRGLYHFDPAKGAVEVLDKQYDFGPYDFVRDGSPTGGPFPGLRSPWYDKECRRKGDARAIAMDLDIDPQGSVSQFFDPIMIHALKEEYCCEPYWEGEILCDPDSGEPRGLVPVSGGPLRLWLRPDGSGRVAPAPYRFGADISTGIGRSPSVASGVNGLTGEKVMEYTSNRLRPEQFAIVCVALCRWFKDDSGEGAYFAWELAGPGMTFGKRVIELGYRNIFYRTAEIPTTTKTVVSDNPGWYCNPDTKRLLLEEYRGALHDRNFINRSEPAMLECLDYKWNKRGVLEHSGSSGGQDPTNAGINHGDHVIADGLACKLLRPGTLKRRQKEHVPPVAIGSLAWRRALHEERHRQERAWR